MKGRYEARLKETFRKLLLSAAAASVGCSGSAGAGGGANEGAANDAGQTLDATSADSAGAADATVSEDASQAPDGGVDATLPGLDAATDALPSADDAADVATVDAAACTPFRTDASDCDFFVSLPCGVPPDAQVESCYFALTECAVLCSQNPGHACAILECLATDAGIVPDASALTLDCASGGAGCGPGPGRRPEGLEDAPPARRGSVVADALAEMARLEAASVFAFRHLRDELVTRGAPRRLVRKAERSARDEIRHARVMRGLARRRGALPAGASKPAREPRSLEAFATENAIEGCVRESFAALLAHRQAERAPDPRVRRAMRAIADDETRHAALAWQVANWVHPRLGADARRRVAEAMTAAVRSLRAEMAAAPAALATELGLPVGLEARALLEGFAAAMLG